MRLPYFLFWIFPNSLGSQYALSNKHIKLGAEPWPPLIVMKKDENGKDNYSGILWDLIKMIQKERNCTFTVVRPSDGLWGSCYGKNNCTGMIGMVQRKEIDFALGCINYFFFYHIIDII